MLAAVFCGLVAAGCCIETPCAQLLRWCAGGERGPLAAHACVCFAWPLALHE